MKERRRIIIVHGYCLLREGFIERLKQESWIDVCAVVSSIKDVPDMIATHRPHLIIANVAPKCSHGMAALKALRREFEWVKILAFSCSSEFEDVHAGFALNSGADGYISSADSSKELILAVRTICKGKRYVSSHAKLHQNEDEDVVLGLKELSRREAEVFCLIGCGYATKRIAALMNVTANTIETYRERIRQKLRLKDKDDLMYNSVSFMRSAARRGIDGPDDFELIKSMLSATT